MAKGYDTNRKRQELLDSFGRELARRSGSKCELCGAAGVPLSVMEVPPAGDDPDAAMCIFLCGECRGQIEIPKKFNASHWRSLEEKVWSDILPVKIMALRILRKTAGEERWAADILEEVFLDDEEQELADSFPV